VDGVAGVAGLDLDWFLAAASDLLAIPSTADRPDQLHRALEYVLGFVGPGFEVRRFESAGKPSALVYTGRAEGAEDPTFHVILNAHLDVVPADADGFQPRRDGDRLYARGAQDMKISALAEALAFRELAASLPQPVALQLVTDEEVGGRNGTRHQLACGVRGRFVIIGETSGLRIVTESKGMLGVNLRAEGHGAHSAYQWLGHYTDPGRPEIARLQAAARDQGFEPDFLRKHGAGDGRFYGALGIAAVAFGVGGHGQHGAGEYAEISTIGPYHQALRQFLAGAGQAG
jgi:acetylornithine deacetylase/succinyl-diaminopimelate desuccinylase-like protein